MNPLDLDKKITPLPYNNVDCSEKEKQPQISQEQEPILLEPIEQRVSNIAIPTLPTIAVESSDNQKEIDQPKNNDNENSSKSKLRNYYITIGNACMDAKKFDEAKAAFEQALKLEPSNNQIKVLLGELFYKMDDYDSCIKTLESCQLKKGNPYCVTLASAYCNAQEIDKAIQISNDYLNSINKKNSTTTKARYC